MYKVRIKQSHLLHFQQSKIFDVCLELFQHQLLIKAEIAQSIGSRSVVQDFVLVLLLHRISFDRIGFQKLQQDLMVLLSKVPVKLRIDLRDNKNFEQSLELHNITKEKHIYRHKPCGWSPPDRRSGWRS